MTIPSQVDSPELQLRRFLYMNFVHNTYLTGNPEIHGRYRDRLDIVDTLLSDDPIKVCRIVATINSENQLPRRETLFVVLAAALSSKVAQSFQHRAELYSTLELVCRDDEDLFMFIKYIQKYKKKFSSGLNKFICRYYKKKQPLEMVQDVCRRKSYHSWTHKDLIKLTHLKPENNLQQIAILFILKGINEAESFALEKGEGMELIEYMKQNHAFKTSESDEDVIRYIEEHKLTFDEVPAAFKKNMKVLEALLPHSDVRQILNLLLRLWKCGLIRHESSATTQLVEVLSNPSKVKASGVHPSEVYCAMKFFEKGGKPKDPHLVSFLENREKKEKAAANIIEYVKTNFAHLEPIKSVPISAALKDCLTLSYQNIVPTNRRFLITVEVSDAMEKPCLNGRGLTAYEAAAIEILSFLKTEKHVLVAVFNAASITHVSLDKGSNVLQTLKKLKEAEHGELQMGAPLEWARSKKKQIDVFINIVYSPRHEQFRLKDQPLVNPLDAYVKYKSTMNMSTTKLILHNMQEPLRTCFPETSLDIRGYDRYVPKIIDAYIKNLI